MKNSILIFFLFFSSACLQAQIKTNTYEHSKEDANNCVECHDMGKNKKFFHIPVKMGSCNNCHSFYNNNDKLLRMENGPNLCVFCHTSKEVLLQEDKNVHPPVKQSCTGCHDPHSGDIQYRLKADKRKDLCLGCHTEKVQWIKNSKNKHGAIDLADGGCFGCHDPHGTSRPNMLRVDSTKELCLSCHNETLKRDEDGKTLLNMAEHLKNNDKWHGPIIAGDCTSCHNPHGSNNPRMLRGKYPEKSTTKFKEEKYLCFSCHDSEKITQKFTTTFTKFRDKNKNLHTLHVQKSSIACGTCHDFHAVKDDIPLIKQKTNFGRAKFNLKYLKTPDGGSCNPICHQKKEYKRGDTPKP